MATTHDVVQPVVGSPFPWRSSAWWEEYFRRNAHDLLPIHWVANDPVTESDVDAIASSVQGFQLGESSEGRHLMRCARHYAVAVNDPEYVGALALFIKEEQRHARDLARFMLGVGIPTIKKTWPDTVFRKLRHLAGLEVSVGVLVTAEIIAKVYYPALRAATSSPVLRALCDQIIRDERAHVEFQCERLAMLRRTRSSAALSVTHALHRILFAGTIWVVWLKHRRALHAGGHGVLSFRRVCWNEFRLARTLMDPRCYRDAAVAAGHV